MLGRIRRIRRHLPLVGLALVLGVTVAGSGPALSASLPSGAAVETATAFGSALTIAKPSTVATGDVLIASLDARLADTGSITPPAGWNLIRRDNNGPGNSPLSQALYYKVAAASEPSSYSWNFS